MSDRACKQCGTGIVRRADEQTGNFSRRNFCDGSCRSKWTRARQTNVRKRPIYARIEQVLRKDPLEIWQIEERFGLTWAEAREVRRRVVRRGMARAS